MNRKSLTNLLMLLVLSQGRVNTVTHRLQVAQQPYPEKSEFSDPEQS